MLNFGLTLAFIFTHLLFIFPIKKIIQQEKMDNDFLFIYLSNLLLLFAFFYYYLFLPHLFLAFFTALFLMIFSYLLFYHTKNLLGRYQVLSFPYFFLCVFNFANIFVLYLF